MSVGRHSTQKIVVMPGRAAGIPERTVMFGAFRRYFSTDLAIDLGTANTLIYLLHEAEEVVLELPGVRMGKGNSNTPKDLITY